MLLICVRTLSSQGRAANALHCFRKTLCEVGAQDGVWVLAEVREVNKLLFYHMASLIWSFSTPQRSHPCVQEAELEATKKVCISNASA